MGVLCVVVVQAEAYLAVEGWYWSCDEPKDSSRESFRGEYRGESDERCGCLLLPEDNVSPDSDERAWVAEGDCGAGEWVALDAMRVAAVVGMAQSVWFELDDRGSVGPPRGSAVDGERIASGSWPCGTKQPENDGA